MRTLTSTIALCLIAGAVQAQQTTRETPGRTTERAATPGQPYEANGQHQNLDQQIAACLLLGNQEEVALAKHAEQHAQNPQVKAFAKMLAEQHGKAVAKIQAASPEVADLQLAVGRENAGATAAGDPTATSLGAANANPGIALLQQVKAQCLQLTQQELAEHQGADFDKAYVGQQIGAHLGMLAQLRGSKSFASPELQKIIAEGEKMTEAHLAEAKKLMGQIKDQGSQTAARSTATKQ